MSLNPKKTLCLGLLVGALLLAMLGLFSRREPTYQGRSLSGWAEQYGSNHWSGNNRAAEKEAEFAIRQIGSNAIPFLLQLMQRRDSTAKTRLKAALPQKWYDTLGLRDRAGDVRRIGAHGLAALGTNAPTAVAPLIDLAKNHPDEDGRYIAVFALGTLGSAAEPAIPFLVECLTNRTSIIRDDAVLGLGYIHRRPEISVPALIQHLKSASTLPGNAEVVNTISSLAEFGDKAKAAVPLLLSLLNSQDSMIRETVTNHLPRIDPDAAKANLIREQ
jgi:hypothetical protein